MKVLQMVTWPVVLPSQLAGPEQGDIAHSLPDPFSE